MLSAISKLSSLLCDCVIGIHLCQIVDSPLHIRVYILALVSNSTTRKFVIERNITAVTGCVSFNITRVWHLFVYYTGPSLYCLLQPCLSAYILLYIVAF